MKLLQSLLCLALVTPALTAQEVKFGLQGTAALPQGDLKTDLDNQVGLGLGAHALFTLQGPHAILGRLDYVRYDRSEGNTDFTFSELRIGADYNYYFSGKVNEGLYITGGLGYASGKGEVSNPSGSYSDSEGAIYLGAGAGWMFHPNMGVEAKYNSVSYDFGGESYSAPAIHLTFIVRF